MKAVALQALTFASPFDAAVNWGQIAQSALDMDERLAKLTGTTLAYVDVVRSFGDFVPILLKFTAKMKTAAR